VPGRWEGDLPIGKDCKSAASMLVKRTSRYVLLLGPPAGRNASLAGHGVQQAITTQPAPSPGSKAKKVAYQFW
jgi:transposase, IS30 family